MGVRWDLDHNELSDNLIIDDVQHMRIDIKMNMRKRRFTVENGSRAPPSTPKHQPIPNTDNQGATWQEKVQSWQENDCEDHDGENNG